MLLELATIIARKDINRNLFLTIILCSFSGVILYLAISSDLSLVIIRIIHHLHPIRTYILQ